MKKVLIWNLNFQLKNSGGPAGYLYNIKSYLDSIDEDAGIVFLSELYPKTKSISNSALAKRTKKLDNPLVTFWANIYRTLRFLKNKSPKEVLEKVDINEFDVIHFHSPIDLYLALDLIKQYKGIVLLTSHSPEPMASEIVNHIYNGTNSITRRWSYKKLAKAERLGFERADYIMFPTPYSAEPYMVDNELKKLLELRKEKVVYCPTATLDIELQDKDPFYFKKLCGIPVDSFNIVYIGRHNEVKGYADLKEIAEKVIGITPNVYFIIAGKEGPLYGLESTQWIELGWTNKAAEIIRNADVFILPNRETYFDLIALEVLRAGTPMILTNTGGNKYFKDITNIGQGIFVYDRTNYAECIDFISELKEKKNNGTLAQLGLNNRKLWEEHFTLKSYLQNYRSMIEKLNSNEK